ncbi:MAG TPA: aminotransferase class I/II-fold pyridoxal phosphate-dependent enzyme [Candidatus Agrococcus pullicola]|uniref:cysteine-S-conjugate beta-lyase n=1 Tax=Candidatus Agrococcus pullicola TaxID=2838429 RepID=A0A9D1YUX5_9MICO|nr:aminotransferase class I/II-fold pyridoxal phosphate-dependent enzyme [Candidatus Agrococcus pullicola]
MAEAHCTHPFDRRERSDLERRESRKWSLFPGTIGAWVAETDFGTAPAVKEALHDAIDSDVLGYLATPLAKDLSETVGTWLADQYNWRVEPKRIHHITDVLAGLRIATRFVTPGSPVIVPTPAYMPVLTLLPAIGHPVIEVPGAISEGRWQHDLDGIDGAFSSGAELLFLCNPQNPTGTVLTRPELENIAKVVDKHGGRVFADEIHAPLRFDGLPHIPYAALNDTTAGHTVTATSTSKAWNVPGLKAAQLILSNDEDQEKYRREALGAPFEASTLGVIAANAAYRDGREWLAEKLDYLAQHRAFLQRLLAEHAPSIRWQPNEATYLAWLDLGEPVPDAAAKFREAGVALTPGRACGQGYDNFVRLTYATPKPILTDAITRIGRAL